MALLKCSECSNEVSDKAVSCPKCGNPLQASASKSLVDLDALIKDSLSREGKIPAIKLYREHNPRAGLAEAKQYVERVEAGLPQGATAKPTPQGCSPIVLFGGLFIAGILVFVGWLLFTKPESRDSNPAAVASPKPPDSYLTDYSVSTVSWAEVDNIYNVKSKSTDLQKDAAWKKYQGKKIKWNGTVTSVSDGFGSLSLQVKMNADTFTSDLLIKLKESQKSKALTLKKDDSVTFTGTLDKWGSLLPITLNEGEIVN